MLALVSWERIIQPEGFKLDITIELNLSAGGYVTLLLGTFGVWLIRNDSLIQL